MYDANCTDIKQMLQAHTHLSSADLAIIEPLCSVLDYIACLTEADIFVNALTTNGYDSIVLKWAKPPKKSIYQKSVVGQLAHPFNEPGVYKTLVTGEPSFGIRGLSQERIPIAQTVVPVRNSQGKVIAALIMERDITDQVTKEAQVELLSQTAEHLARTLMGLSINKTSLPDHLHQGVIVLNAGGDIQYLNNSAALLLQQVTDSKQLPFRLQALPQPLQEALQALNQGAAWSRETRLSDKFIKIEGIPLSTGREIDGAVVILTDITDLREKEKELVLKSVAIQEIHHRVKNNLQNIASLLRLQMRRLDHPAAKEAFAESIQRILSMALVYDVLANQSMNDVDFKELCTKVLELSDFSPQGCQIARHITGPAIILPSTQAVTLSLILNELINNALKHAFTGRKKGNIDVEIIDCGAEAILGVKDDGLGFQPTEVKTGHLGLEIVKVLAEEKLNGTFNIENRQGILATIKFTKEGIKEV